MSFILAPREQSITALLDRMSMKIESPTIRVEGGYGVGPAEECPRRSCTGAWGLLCTAEDPASGRVLPLAVSELTECLAIASFCSLRREVEVSLRDLGGEQRSKRSTLLQNVTDQSAEETLLVQDVKSIFWPVAGAADKGGGQPAGSGCTREDGEVRFSRTLNIFSSCRAS